MNPMRDPFAQVHPLFWPVLWLSLRAFVRWTRRMIEDGHGFAGLRVEITWYGWIHVQAIDLSEVGKDFRRHMAGIPRAGGLCILDLAAERAVRLLSGIGAEDVGAGLGSAAATPFRLTAFWMLAAPGIGAHSRRVSRKGTGPPEAHAPLPSLGEGASVYNPLPRDPQVCGRLCWT
ncbi:MAG: hypothetical protein AAF829_11995 [Pseudomonadota bacterium]